MRRAGAMLVAALAVALFASASRAQDASREAQANRLFGAGAAAFGEGRFEEAVRAFRAAYQVLPAPPLLYNLARALEGAHQEQEAIAAYERYLALGTEVANRGEVEQSLQALRQRVAERRAREAASRAEQASASVEPPRAVQPSMPAARPQYGSVAPWVVFGAGLLLLAGSLTTAVIAGSTYRDAQRATIQQDAARLDQTADDLALATNALLVGGAIASAIGIVWAIVDGRATRRANHAERSVGFVVTPRGAIVSFAF